MKRLRLLFAVNCIFILLACQQQQEAEMTPITDKSEIISKWKEGDRTVEIFEDGKLVYTDKQRKVPVIGSYELVDGNILKASYAGFETQDYKAYMLNGELILHGINDDSKSRLKRVN